MMVGKSQGRRVRQLVRLWSYRKQGEEDAVVTLCPQSGNREER